ncbi:dTMP kinase [Shouchella clausii]|uniref:dTMP kinase n=1 Tax=Shouchella clausii TaxID=79880 RepID=UPI00079C3829|nr:dTMP kinase [Shouchella clausii]KKI85797.1 thymidylate kinase [Shouchella clausii]PAD13803.1 dTMP kinase [Shouchella clausii]
MKKGLFITVEGGEGAGKTTIINLVQEQLATQGYQVIRTREPGGVELAEQIRDLLLHTQGVEMDNRTEALLYAAARREHLIKKIVPALAEGALVLCDRYIDSSLVYQGHARGIGMEEVRAINGFAIETYMPDLTLYFDVEPEIGLERVQKDAVRSWNRLDQETLTFHKRVQEGYKKLLKAEPERIKAIDANRSFAEVFHDTMEEINRMLLSTKD